MKKFIKRFILFLLISVVAEVLVFNLQSFESLFYSPVQNVKLSYGSGYSVVGNTIFLPEQGEDRSQDEDDWFIEISEINEEVHNMYFNVVLDSDANVVQLVLLARDRGSDEYYEMPPINVSPDSKSSQYIKLNLNGEAKSIRMRINGYGGRSLTLNNLTLNARRPFIWSMKRIAVLFMAMLIIYIIRPGSALYKIRYSFKEGSQRWLILLLLLAQMLSVVYVVRRNPEFVSPTWEHHYQYHKLAVSLTEGHFYLNDEPSEALRAMDNPYDYLKRDADGVPYIWDQAYYQGKYYVYFGILPVLTFYLPYYLITGQAFPTYMGIILTEIAIIIGVFMLLHILVKKYFKRISLGNFLIMDVLLFLGCGGLVIAGNAFFYSLPVAMAIALTLWGLYFWFSSIRGDGGLQNCRVIAGSLLMALVAACRPQLLVGSFFAFPIFWRHMKQGLWNKGKLRRDTIINIVCFALPYIIVAALLMYYNYARFGSPFDFGANYNITTNDMTSRGFHLDRLPLGTYMYLFQPPSFNAKFPFLFSAPFVPAYQGITIYESMYGGIMFFNPLMFVCVYYFKVKDRLKEKKLNIMVVMSIIVALLVMAVDIEMAGLLMRYFCDFGIFLMIPAVIIFLSGMEMKENSDTLRIIWQKLLFGITVMTAGLSFLWLMAI